MRSRYIFKKIEKELSFENTICIYDGMQITDIDFESKLVHFDNDYCKMDDIDETNINIYEYHEIDLSDDLSDYLKIVKKVKKTIDNINNIKTGELFSLKEEFILSHEQMIEFNSIIWLTDNWNDIQLFKFKKRRIKYEIF